MGIGWLVDWDRIVYARVEHLSETTFAGPHRHHVDSTLQRCLSVRCLQRNCARRYLAHRLNATIDTDLLTTVSVRVSDRKTQAFKGKVKTNVEEWTLDIVPLYGPTPSQSRSGIERVLRDHTVLPATHAFIHKWNEPYLPLPFQPKPVLIYWPRRDGTLSWPRHHHDE